MEKVKVAEHAGVTVEHSRAVWGPLRVLFSGNLPKSPIKCMAIFCEILEDFQKKGPQRVPNCSRVFESHASVFSDLKLLLVHLGSISLHVFVPFSVEMCKNSKTYIYFLVKKTLYKNVSFYIKWANILRHVSSMIAIETTTKAFSCGYINMIINNIWLFSELKSSDIDSSIKFRVGFLRYHQQTNTIW